MPDNPQNNPMTAAQLIERALAAKAAAEAEREQQRAKDAAARAAEKQALFEKAREYLPPEYRPFAFWQDETDDSYGEIELRIDGCAPFTLWSKLINPYDRVWRWRGLDNAGLRFYTHGGFEEKTIDLMVARAHEVAQQLAERAQHLQQAAPAPAQSSEKASTADLLRTAAFMLPDDNGDASLATSVASLAYSMHALARHLIHLQQPAAD